MLKRLYTFLGSLPMAVVLLTVVGGTLAYGTWVEATHNTPAAQRVVYQAWWFQTLLGFLVLNLVISALTRWPWQKRHIGFVTTHLGIILILIGGLLSIRLGIEGQLVIPEGGSSDLLEQPTSVVTIQLPNPGEQAVFPVDFAAQASRHAPHAVFQTILDGQSTTLTVDRYLSNATAEEHIRDDGSELNPAIQVALSQEGHEERAWLFARDPERFGAQWGTTHVLFLDVQNETHWQQLLHPEVPSAPHTLGTLTIEFPVEVVTITLDVEREMGRSIAVERTPYTVTLKQYFPDFAVTADGVSNRSLAPNNPAVAFTVTGPQGTEAHLAFARHPEYAASHGHQQTPLQARFDHPQRVPALPPALLGVLRAPDGALWFVATDADGAQRQVERLTLQQAYTNPWTATQLTVVDSVERARRVTTFTPLNEEVKRQAIHGVLQMGEARAEAWIPHGEAVPLTVGSVEAVVAYQPTTRPLPFHVTLRDFRKQDYPGTTIPQAFESDVVLHDDARGVTLARTVAMNRPLTYHGFKLFQASYVEEPQVMTVLAVRKDPGTPLVYAGFLIVVLGILTMFYLFPHQSTS